jgi:hypothetical protein
MVLGEGHEKIVDARLGVRESGDLANVEAHRGLIDEPEHLVAYESVVHDDLGAREQTRCSNGHEFGAAGPRTHQKDSHDSYRGPRERDARDV